MADAQPQDAPTSSVLPSWFGGATKWFYLGVGFLLFVFPHISPWDGLNQQLRFLERFSQWSIGKLESLFRDYGYLVVFIGVLLENSMFLGLLVPGAIILILAGLAAENGSINIWLVLLLGVLATILGDTISYAIGRMGWTRVLQRGSFGSLMERMRGTLDSNQTWLILAYHWAGYSRVVGPAAAGLFRIPYRRWAPLDYAGGAVWVAGYTGFGVVLGLFGVQFGDTKTMVRLLEWFLTALMVIAVVMTYLRTARPRHTASIPVPVPVDEP